MIKLIAQFKMYAVRSQQYAAIVQVFVTFSMFLIINAKLELFWWHYIIVFIVAISIFILVGFLDVKFKVLSEEQRLYGEENPIFTDIKDRLKRIEKKL